MKLKLALATVVALTFLSASTAQASRYYLPTSLARHETRIVAIEDCNAEPECAAYGVGRCEQRSASRVDCIEALYFPDRYGEQECDYLLHWGVSYGVVRLKGYSKPYCYYH